MRWQPGISGSRCLETYTTFVATRECEICQRTKINLSHRSAPLHPIPVPNAVGTRFVLDHKVLPRTTLVGNNAVLVVVECF